MPAPAVLGVDAARCVLYLERVPGPTARAFVDANRADPARVGAVLAALGGAVARLHAAGLVHGDLTTSNAVCRAADDVVLIDFGLAGASAQVEDRAVDLDVLERALASTHRDADGLVAAVLAAYAAAAADANGRTRLAAVRARAAGSAYVASRFWGGGAGETGGGGGDGGVDGAFEAEAESARDARPSSFGNETRRGG